MCPPSNEKLIEQALICQGAGWTEANVGSVISMEANYGRSSHSLSRILVDEFGARRASRPNHEIAARRQAGIFSLLFCLRFENYGDS